LSLRIPAVTLGPETKGFCCPETMTAEEFVAASHDLFDGSLTFPVMTLDQPALTHNIDQLARFAEQHQMQLAPHGKTTMAPAIFAAQLGAGAWGLTVASGQQLMAAYSFGIRHLLVANEILDPAVLRWIDSTSTADPATEMIHYIDSAAGVDAITAISDSHRFAVLIELGYPGGRTGVRSLDEVLELARYARELGVWVVGVSGYEGGLDSISAVRAFLRDLHQAGTALAEAGLVDASEIILSAGGSAYFDLVAEELGGVQRAGLPARMLLRSGSYVTHDHGVYQRRTPFNRVEGELRPAIRVWASVTSRPEPELALVALGKRDIPFDEGLPVPLTVRRPDGSSTRQCSGWELTRTNDQHGYLEPVRGAAQPSQLSPGDVIEFGISHPCTAFDKWRAVPVLDGHRIVDVYGTYF
jgi:D-serine deaminase-like pyridoxal phosphate-dependent protein